MCLRVGEDGTQDRPYEAAQRNDVYKVVLRARGQLHEAAEALEGAVAVRLQVHCNLARARQAAGQRAQLLGCLYICQRRVIQPLQSMLQGSSLRVQIFLLHIRTALCGMLQPMPPAPSSDHTRNTPIQENYQQST
jgi:hypothetical protein